MALNGYLVCDGCGCRTKTVPADPDAADWPCCEHFPDGVPCRYAVIARCYSAVDIGIPHCLTGTTFWPLFYPVTEFRKLCYVGCEWVHRPYCGTIGAVTDYSGALLDQVPDAINTPQAFPPASYPTGGPLTYHPGDYRDDAPCLAPGQLVSDANLDDNWVLEIGGTAAGSVTITLAEPFILAWAAANGKATPVYTNDETWEAFGTNTDAPGFAFGNRMTIDSAAYRDWPMLPKSICVVALDDPGVVNPCTSHEAQCNCCDFGGDTVQFIVDVVGCEGFAGTQVVTSTRECNEAAFEAAYPGADYPASAPCCVWPFITGDGAGCTSASVNWGGTILNVIYCNGDTYAGDVYCFDTDINEWVLQGALSVTDFRCLCGCETFTLGDASITLCNTWVIAFTLPELDCCCPGLPACDCAPTGTPDPPLYFDITSTCGTSFETTSTVEAPFDLVGCWSASGAGSGGMPPAIDIVDICCEGDEWTCQLTFVPAECGSPTTVASTGTCDPFALTFTFSLDAACCPPSGGTVTVEVMA